MNREYAVRYWIKEMITSAIRCAKRNNTYTAREYIVNLRGMLHYMLSVGDITDFTNNKVYNLTRIIVKKYNLYQGSSKAAHRPIEKMYKIRYRILAIVYIG